MEAGSALANFFLLDQNVRLDLLYASYVCLFRHKSQTDRHGPCLNWSVIYTIYGCLQASTSPNTPLPRTRLSHWVNHYKRDQYGDYFGSRVDGFMLV